MVKTSAIVFAWLVLTGVLFRISAEELAAGSLLEARLSVVTGSGV